MYTLRGYQVEAVKAAMAGFDTYKPFIIQAATAAGKSLIIAEICHRLGRPVLILQPNKEILEQNYDKLSSYGITDIGKYSASANSKEIAKFTFATIGSIYRKPDLFKHFEYVILDECHQLNPKEMNGMYSRFFRDIKCTRVCGLTATPFRLENKLDFSTGTYSGACKMLNRITRSPFFKNIVYKIEMPDLLEQGYLAPLEYHIYDTDIAELMPNSGRTDFTADSLERWSDKKLSSLSALAPLIEKKSTGVVVFCTSILQSRRALLILRDANIAAEAISADTPKKEREAMLKRFKSGELKWIVNVGVLTTGFDAPSMDTVVLMRPTMSIALYMQMVGRAVRLDPNRSDKVAHVYDITGTVQKYGRVETMRVRKEAPDSYKDCLFSEVGRLDDQLLFEFPITKDRQGNIKYHGEIATGTFKRELTYLDLINAV